MDPRTDPSRTTLASTVLDYAKTFLDSLPERPAAAPDPLTRLPPTAPDALPAGCGAGPALAAFVAQYGAGLSGSAGPRYFGFVTGGSTPAALAGDWLTSTFDQNVSNHIGSVAARVEHETLGWLRALFGLPARFHGSFVSGATAANTVALATARQVQYQRRGVDVAVEGLTGAPPTVVFAGAAHSSIDKALAILGLGRRSLQRLPCLPGRTAIDPQALAGAFAALARDTLCIVIASAGEVNTGDFDDLATLANICREHGAWLHVDGAFGLFTALLPGAAGDRLAGIASADSITVDLHKWLNVPYDSGVVYTAHPAAQRAVFRASSVYLGDSDDPLHGTPENSRRFRALPAWLSLKAYGRSGVAGWVAANCAQARQLAEGIHALPALELLSPVHLNIVCFALRQDPSAAARDRFLSALNADGRCFMTATALFGRPAIRAALSNWSTTAADIDITLAALSHAAHAA